MYVKSLSATSQTCTEMSIIFLAYIDQQRK